MFETPETWESEWDGMPEFVQDDKTPADSITVQFETHADRHNFLVMLGENPARRKSIWWPQKKYLKQSFGKPKKVPQNRYPVYIISKGRWESRHTSKSLESLGIEYRIVVEPQEYKNYSSVINPDKIHTPIFKSRTWVDTGKKLGSWTCKNIGTCKTLDS